MPEGERQRVLALTEQLAELELSLKVRLMIVAQIRLVLLGEQVPLKVPQKVKEESRIPAAFSQRLGPIFL
jgi:hypothetical protein